MAMYLLAANKQWNEKRQLNMEGGEGYTYASCNLRRSRNADSKRVRSSDKTELYTMGCGQPIFSAAANSLLKCVLSDLFQSRVCMYSRIQYALDV